jgi:phosphate starvation-inducible protein PhoH and related proteins
MSKKSSSLAGNQLVLTTIEPLTQNQKLAFESEKNLVLHGMAGTGKTYVASYVAYRAMSNRDYTNLVIIRSAVPTRDIGFLPGTQEEKSAVYEEPYKDVAADLFQRGDAYSILKQKFIVEFMTTSFIRGITIDNSVIIVDECQNMTFHELDSIITRVGLNCRIIFCGDFRQDDFKGKREQSGMIDFMKVLERTGNFDMIEYQVEDIVRSDFVKDYIIAKNELGYD